MADPPDHSASQTSTPQESTVSTSSAPATSNISLASAPAPTSSAFTQPGQHADGAKHVKQISCIQCQQRKIKCNKASPCSHCTKSRLECVYRPPAPPRRGGLKRKAPTTEADLLARLRRCEELLRSAGVEVDGDGNVAGPDGPAGSQRSDGGGGGGASDGEKLPSLASLVGKEGTYGHALVTANTENAASHGLSENEGVEETASAPSDAAQPGRPTNENKEDRGRMMVEENGRQHYVESYGATLKHIVVGRSGALTICSRELWNSIGAEKTSSKDLSHVDGDGQKMWQTDQGQQLAYSQGDGAFIFDTPSSRADLYDLHPSRSDAKALWNIFKENIDPLTKIFHASTLEIEILETCQNLRNIPDNLEATMFAVYASAVHSISATECEETFGISRSILTARFGTGAKKAFINAGILMTSDFKLLQAFVLWLLSIRQTYDPRALWTLTGVALRLGQRQGLHRERALKAGSVFEAEMRRRLWWQIMILDSRAAELSGSGVSIFVNLFDTDKPRNLNDQDIDPNIKELPPERTGATDMIFVALRSEFGSFLRKSMPTSVGASTFQGAKDEDIKKFEQVLEQKYLRFCDALYPLQLLTSIVGRAALATVKLITHHPSQYADGGTSMPQEEKDMLFSLSLKLIKYDQLIRATKVLNKYLWHCDAYFPWHAFIYLLSYISSKEATKEKCIISWEQVHQVFETNSHIVTDIKKPLHVAIGNLTLKAWEVNGQHATTGQRHHSLTSGSSPQTPPNQDQSQNQRSLSYFISILRAQRAPKTGSSDRSPNSTSTPSQQSFKYLPSSTNLQIPTSSNKETTFFNTSLHTWPYLKTSGPTPNPAMAAAMSTASTSSNSDTGGMGTASFFPFLPPPPAFQPHLKNKHQNQQHPQSPTRQSLSLSPAPLQATTFPPTPSLASDPGPMPFIQDPMTIENMAMGLDMANVDWAEWDRLLAQDFDSMIPGPAATGFGLGHDGMGGP